MTTITEGMSPSQFITAMNNNFTTVKYNTTSFSTISTSSVISDINTNFSTTKTETPSANINSVFAGMSGQMFVNLINQNFSDLDIVFPITKRDFSGLTRYAGNPIIPRGIYYWNATQTDPPYAKLENKIGNTWYAPLQATHDVMVFNTLVVYTSTDLLTWVSHPSNPVLTNTPGSWDDHFLMHPSVIKIGNLWYMYYAAMDASDRLQIGLATSPDFITWTKYGTSPVFSITDRNCNEGNVIKIGNIYYMYFTNSEPIYHFTSDSYICYATSSDGLTWTYGGIVMKATATDWCSGKGFLGSWVNKRATGIYEMVFSISEVAQETAYAVSKDGIHWQLHQATVFTKGAPGQWDETQVGDVLLLEKADGTTYLYYAGVDHESYAAGGVAIL